MESTNWQYTFLIKQNKLIVLQHFNLNKLFPNFWVVQIWSLWNNFYLLYMAIKNSKTDTIQFFNNTHAWLYQFWILIIFIRLIILHCIYIYISILYFKNNVHLLPFGLVIFWCSTVEKKIINKFYIFFKKTTKNGDTRKGRNVQL